MATAELNYGTSDQAITCSIASLSSTNFYQSLAIDNTTNKFVDALVGGKIMTGTSPTVDTRIELFAYGTVDGGTLYSGNCTGTDTSYTASNNEDKQLFPLGVITVGATSNTSYEFGPFSVAGAFGGTLPQKWGIVVLNLTAADLHATAGNHDINYQGVKGTVA